MAEQVHKMKDMVDDMTGIASGTKLRERLASLGKSWGWFLAGGIAYIILGIIAFSYPVASTVGLILALGVMFLVGGAIELIHTVQMRKEIGTGWRLFDSLISLAAGVLLLRYPGGGMIGLAIAMIFYFFMSAAAKTVVAFGTRPLPGSGWAFVSAIASFVLGIYMIAQFPVSAFWVPGLLLGINFVFHGVSMVGFSGSVRKLHKEAEEKLGAPSEERRAA
jgi:uncharacterized membrane protein HdeD (DUF308 family)